jgi:hypothetical protein
VSGGRTLFPDLPGATAGQALAVDGDTQSLI